MADNTFRSISSLPAEVLTLIGQNLTTLELAQFKKTCRLFNHIGSDAHFLKPLYHRLYKLDKTLPVLLTPENAAHDFKKAFEKIRERQNQEIAFLNEKHPQAYRGEIEALLNNTGNTIEKLEERNILLNAINSLIIDAVIAEQPGTLLNLNRKGLTRFIITKDKVDYFKNLITLNCCYNNQLTSLNLDSLKSLQTLFCTHNRQLTTLSLQGLTSLWSLTCHNSPLSTLNLEGLTALKLLWCQNNQLTTLNLQGLTALQLLNCPKNPLTTLSLQGLTSLWSLTCHNSPLSTLNLEGLTALKLLWCQNNQLTTLNLQGASRWVQENYSEIEATLLFRKLSYATAASERVEIIKRLGRRYTLSNCLKHGCVYEAGMVSYQGAAASVYIGFCSVVNRMPRFLPSFSSRRAPNEAPLNETIEQKRKRENNNNNEGTEHKKPRPDGA